MLRARIILPDGARECHAWLAVRRVYSELFLSPLDDPWYGLSRPDVFSAIKDDGHIDVVTRNSRD